MTAPRVLLTGPQWFGDLLSFCERALIDLGVEVSVFPTNYRPWLSQLQRRREQFARLPIAGSGIAWRLERKHRAKLVSEINRNLIAAARQRRPDLLLSILCWGEPISRDTLEEVGSRRKVCWLMDDPFKDGEKLGGLLGSFDRSYAVEDSWVEPVQLVTGRPASALACGADLQSHHPVLRESVPDSLRSGVLFLGSSYHGEPAGVMRGTLLQHLQGFDLRVYGDDGWAKTFAGNPEMSRCFQGTALNSEKANLAYNGADIVLNIHHPQFRIGTSLRTFNICASGGFQFVDWRSGLDRFFEPDEEIVAYRTPEELRDKAEYYLKEEGLRSLIARRGYERVLRDHTYVQRLAHILEEAGLTPPKSTHARSPRRAVISEQVKTSVASCGEVRGVAASRKAATETSGVNWLTESLEYVDCSFCGSSNHVLYDTVGDWNIVKCDGCGLCFTNPRPSRSVLTDLYDLSYFKGEEFERFGYFRRDGSLNGSDEAESLERIETIESNFERRGKLLEIGAALGIFLKVMRDRGWEVEGVEISREAVQIAKLQGIDVFCGALEEFETDHEYDVVCMYHSLEHVPDPAYVIERAYNLLSPGGIVVIEVPNLNSFDSRIDNTRKLASYDVPRHLSHFEPRVLASKLQEVGFEVANIDLYYPQFVLRSVSLRERIGGRKLRVASQLREPTVKGRSHPPLAKHSTTWKDKFLKSISTVFPGWRFTIVGRK